MSNVRPDTGLNYVVALEFLVQELSPRLLNVILNTKKGQVNKWIADPALMNESQKKLVSSLHDVVSILRTYLSAFETKLWLVDHSDFLFGVPAKEIRYRPEDVRMAALNRVARGEDWEVYNRIEKEERRQSEAEDPSSEYSWE